MRECPVTHEVSIRSRTVTLAHQDPADRVLAANAIVYEATFLTADSRLLLVPDLPVTRAD
jgi:PIN domain nuclease of toxin-antitoxin system